MRKNRYAWGLDQKPPEIDDHSIAKHHVLRSYLVRYVEVLAANHRIDSLRLSLVDGFSGGGLYRLGSGGVHSGSPLVFLESMAEAETKLNTGRVKPFKLDTHFYFVEKNRQALESLTKVVREGYAQLVRSVEKDIDFIEGEFSQRAEAIIESIRSRGRAGRSIFLLDQYGYIDVPLPLLRRILAKLPKAEIILTFAVDSLVDYMADTKQFQGIIDRLGLSEDIDLANIVALKKAGRDWRFIIQSQLHKALVRGSGAEFFTPFFIVSRQSGRSYWLVHLSNHVRARDEMTTLHWQLHTYFSHHGSAGLNMLGYDPQRDSSLTGQTQFVFDDEARRLTEESLLVDIPKIISANPDGVTFFDLLSRTCNNTPATSAIYRNAIGALLAYKELEVVGSKGEHRRKGQQVEGVDVLRLPRQRTFFPLA